MKGAAAWIASLQGAAFALAALALAACGATEPEIARGEDEVTTEALGGKSALFDEPMLFVRIAGWAGDPDALPTLRDSARLGDATLRIFRADPKSQEHCPADGALVFESKAFEVRTSGNLTNGTPKSSYKISLEDKDDRLFGMRSLNLKSMWNDASLMREAIAWGMLRDAGVVAPRHGYAKLCVDGSKNGAPFTKYMGLYSLVEQVDKAMLKDHFGKENAGGNLYKQYFSPADLGPATLAYRSEGGDDSGRQYWKNADNDQRTYQLKSNDSDGDPEELQSYDDLATLIRVVNGITTEGDPAKKFESDAYAEAIERIFNVRQFLRWAAVNTLLGAWDNYWATPANYYLYNSGRHAAGDAFMREPYFTWVPWDYDNVLGTSFHGADWARSSVIDFATYDGRSSNMANLPLLRHLLEHRAFLAYYLDALEDFNERLFEPSRIEATAERLRARIEPAAMLEGSFSEAAHTGRQFTNDEVVRHGFEHHEWRRGSASVLGILHFVRIRHEHVEREVQALRAARGIAKGASGATFPAAAEALPE